MTALLAATAGRLAPIPRRAGRWAARVPPLLWVAAVLTAIVLAGGWLWLRDSGLVAVKKITVLGATGPQADKIRSALSDAAENMTTLHVRTASLRRAVSPYPNVRDVRVATHFPHAMTITVLSARPAAVLAGGGSQAVVSTDGTVLRGSFDQGALPTIQVDAAPPPGGHATGRLTLAAVRAVAAVPAPLRSRVSKAFWTGAHGLEMDLRNGPLLIFGDAGRTEDKWYAAARVLADPSSKGADYLDLRVPERPAAGGVAPEGQGQSWGDAAAQAAAEAGDMLPGGTTGAATPSTGTATPSTTPPSTSSTTPSTTGSTTATTP
jgi:cell division protein FtsQ